jgi:hypothetical protein
MRPQPLCFLVNLQAFSRMVVSTFGPSLPVVVGMKQRSPQSTRPSALPGPPSQFQSVTTCLRSYGHFCRSLLCGAMEGKPLSTLLRLSRRGWLRLSLPLSLRWLSCSKWRNPAPHRRLRARRVADIPTPLPNRNKTKEVSLMLSIHFRSAPLALAARAIASALAPQRFSTTEATAPVVPAPQSSSSSALASSQHLAVNRPLPWGSA